jgi:hypothetical protein
MPEEGAIDRFPHCDPRALHQPSECQYCDLYPEWQALREAWGIAFTGHPPRAGLPRCHRPMRDTQPGYGPGVRCEQPRGHDDDCKPYPAWDVLPCPADAARPPGSPGDHRRWGGNKPTSATGDPSWPAESTASVALYGDKGGRAPWPPGERARRRLRRPLENWRRRRAGWRRDGDTWRYP